MNKKWIITIGIVLLLVAVVGLAGCSSKDGVTLGGDNSALKINLNSQQQGIWVSGEGKVTAVPDVAILSLGIQAQELTVAQAQAEAATAMDSVMNALKDAGVKDNDIQTQNYNIQQITRWDNDKQQQVPVGYQVTNTVTAKIRKIDTAGSVIDAVAAAGGDFTRINSIGLTVDDPTPYYEQARVKAVADAAAKAQKLADTAGVKLGKPTYISESSSMPGPIYRDVATPAAPVPAPTTPISPGEMEITTNVQIAYAIAD
jgi:uncharacterized protein YggE